MATGTPVLASFDSGTELERMIKEEQVGLFSQSDDENQLAENILNVAKNHHLQTAFSQNARRYVIHNLSRKTCTDRYCKIVNECYQNFEKRGNY
jgi:glycosyltransferase involved in cell wall biosynthesis